MSDPQKPMSSSPARHLPGFLGINVTHSTSLADVFGKSRRYGDDGVDPDVSAPQYSRVSVVFDSAAVHADSMDLLRTLNEYFQDHGVMKLGSNYSLLSGQHSPSTTTISFATAIDDLDRVRQIVDRIEEDGLASREKQGPGGTGAPPLRP